MTTRDDMKAAVHERRQERQRMQEARNLVADEKKDARGKARRAALTAAQYVHKEDAELADIRKCVDAANKEQANKLQALVERQVEYLEQFIDDSLRTPKEEKKEEPS